LRSDNHSPDRRGALLEEAQMVVANKEKEGLKGQDKQQGDLVDGGPQEIPEGMNRERKGPLSPTRGRNENGN
jgi:hypothetical protein